MKARGLIVIDYEFPSTGSGFAYRRDAYDKLEAAMKELVKGDDHVKHSDCDIQERRGEALTDIQGVKFYSVTKGKK